MNKIAKLLSDGVSLVPAVGRRFLLAAAAFAACSDNTIVAPREVTPSRASRDGSPTSSPFHSNAEKYRDQGAHPATGRSGSASIQSRALLGKDGNTAFEATTGELDGATPPGEIAKVQLTSLNGNGDAIVTTNFNHIGGGYWSTIVPGLLRYAPMQLQTNVRGIDGNRTDVVTVQTTILQRPDLRVVAPQHPDKAYVNTSVAISALVSELNGDVGARADCELFVDGTQVDNALGIWVDAGDAVSCAFAYTFRSTGTHTVAVLAGNVVPGDWDTANNSASNNIEIVLPIVNLNWYSSAYTNDQGYDVRNGTRTSSNCSYYYNYSLCNYGYETFAYGSQSRNTSFSFSASTSQAAAVFPASLAFSATTDNSPISNASGLIGTAGQQGCLDTYDASTTTWGTICATSGSTSVSFNRYGGASTYYSNGYQQNYQQYTYYCYAWFGGYYYACGWTGSGSSSQWSYNNTSGDPSSLFYLGSQVTVGLTLTDATGRSFVAGGSYPTTSGGYNYTSHYDFTSSGYYVYHESYDRHDWLHWVSGSGSGFGQQ